MEATVSTLFPYYMDVLCIESLIWKVRPQSIKSLLKLLAVRLLHSFIASKLGKAQSHIDHQIFGKYLKT